MANVCTPTTLLGDPDNALYATHTVAPNGPVRIVLSIIGNAKILPSIIVAHLVNVVDMKRRPIPGHVQMRETMRFSRAI